MKDVASESKRLELEGFRDYAGVFVSTVVVGFIPVAPGTFGALVGIGIYLIYGWFLDSLRYPLIESGVAFQTYSALFVAASSILFILLCLISIWASNIAVKAFDKKDPQKVVIDEVIGQLLVFAFIPWGVSYWIVLAGFILFRLFDIWKPYPVKQTEKLEGGLGICGDDLVAGIYGGGCLAIIYFLQQFLA